MKLFGETIGKAKTMHLLEDEWYLSMEFRDDISAGDGAKRETMEGKGKVNCAINTKLMRYLEEEAVATAFITQTYEDMALVRRLDMVPLEIVVRNVAAGSFCRRYGIGKGQTFNPIVTEFFVKDDARHDPLINEAAATAIFGIDIYTLQRMKNTALAVNDHLKGLFAHAGLQLVDFKLEFGFFKENLYLGDELSPDSMRLWDMETGDIKDKDLFRQDSGDTMVAYREVARRIGA